MLNRETLALERLLVKRIRALWCALHDVQVRSILGLRLGPQCSIEILWTVYVYVKPGLPEPQSCFAITCIAANFWPIQIGTRCSAHPQFLMILRVHVWKDWTCTSKRFFRFRSNLAGRLPLVKKMSQAKGFLSHPSESAIPACLSKMGEKSPHINLASKTSVTTSLRNGNTNETSSLQPLLTLVLSNNWKTLTSTLSWTNQATTRWSS